MTEFPFAQPPAPGEMVEVFDGIFWARFALPFALDHVNAFLLRDGDGFLAVDAGIDDARTRADWQALLQRIGGRSRLKRLLVTHHHVDHSGAAGWLARETGCEVLMSPPELAALRRSMAEDATDRTERMRSHYRWLGCPPEEAARLGRSRWRASEYVGPIPDSPATIDAGGELTIGGRRWRVSTGAGHSPALVLLHCEAEGILIAGDQILSRISPFVGTWADQLQTRPLSDYLASLDALDRTLPDPTLVLPGHGLPFRGARQRIAELKAHHAARCALIVESCNGREATVRVLVDRLFNRNLDGVMTMALAETLAHVHVLLDEGRLDAATKDDVLALRSALAAQGDEGGA